MRDYLKAHTKPLGPEEIAILARAFDEAWESVLVTAKRQAEGDEAIRELLAKRIIETATRGERDQERLCQDALEHLAAEVLSAPANPPPHTSSDYEIVKKPGSAGFTFDTPDGDDAA
jgi:hypothetical protein